MNYMALPPGRWFHPSEFACRDGTPYPLEWVKQWMDLRDLCDEARDIHGDVLYVASGYRTPTWNSTLVGKSEAHQVASGSYHVNGMAADLRPRNKADVPTLLAKLLARKKAGGLGLLGGIAAYPVSGWIHVDTGIAPDGHLRRWIGR